VVYAGRKDGNGSEQGALTPGRRRHGLSRNHFEADVFHGRLRGGVLKEAWSRDGRKPLILALANPEPEICPMSRRACAPTRVATGRSIFREPGNNVLCFPFIFPRALSM